MKKIITILFALAVFSFAEVDFSIDAGLGLESSTLGGKNLTSAAKEYTNTSPSSIGSSSAIRVGGGFNDFAIGGEVSYQAHYISAGKTEINDFNYMFGPYFSMGGNGFELILSAGYAITYLNEDYKASWTYCGSGFGVGLTGQFRLNPEGRNSAIIGLRVQYESGKVTIDNNKLKHNQLGVQLFIGFGHTGKDIEQAP